MSAPSDFMQPLGGDVYLIDTGFHRPRFDAAYLVAHDGRAAFVDTGTIHAVPRLLQALDALGLSRDAVDWIIPTHVHLDHAGGVGRLARELPQARVWVHPRGARHLADPSALWAGATAVYGEVAMRDMYGELVPVAAERLVASDTTASIVLGGGRALQAEDTPGHARHHHAIWDARTRGWFTGDTLGLSYREFDVGGRAWLLPTTTPVQFEPDALRATVGRLLQREPQRAYLTHYGMIEQPALLGAGFVRRLDAMLAIARRAPAGDAQARQAFLVEALAALHRAELADHGCGLPPDEIDALLAVDTELNAQGIAVWLDREAATARPTAA